MKLLPCTRSLQRTFTRHSLAPRLTQGLNLIRLSCKNQSFPGVQNVVPHVPQVVISGPVNEFKRFGSVNCSFIWTRSDELAVLLIYSLHDEKIPGIATFPHMPEFGGRGYLWPREFSQSVEEEAVGGDAGEQTHKVAC
jgi:hypothetical protein